jgi:ribosomal protein S24E
MSVKPSNLSEDELFKRPEREECPICFVPLSLEVDKDSFRVCCGKVLCQGCVYAILQNEHSFACPFCRKSPYKSNEEYMQWLQKLVANKHPLALLQMGLHYNAGDFVLAQNVTKAVKLWEESGHHQAYLNLAYHFERTGRNDKFRPYLKKAATLGNIKARTLLGILDQKEDRYSLSIKHLTISAEYGDETAMNLMKVYQDEQLVTKSEIEMIIKKRDQLKKSSRTSNRQIGEFMFESIGVKNGV